MLQINKPKNEITVMLCKDKIKGREFPDFKFILIIPLIINMPFLLTILLQNQMLR